MPTNKNELTQEMMMKAMQCKDADELIALAKAEGKEITKEDAEACLDKMGDFELDENVLENVAGGVACAIVR
jgi:predicted DNA-binding protein